MEELIRKRLTAESVQSFVFGVEDSLVSTVGFVTGLAATGSPKEAIFLSGIILIFVEAFSMGIGELLSTNSAQEFRSKHSVSFGRSVASALVMFVSYLFTGLAIILPYALLPAQAAIQASVALALLCLFLLGVASASFSHGRRLRKGFIMLVIGGLAVGIGMLVGSFFRV